MTLRVYSIVSFESVFETAEHGFKLIASQPINSALPATYRKQNKFSVTKLTGGDYTQVLIANHFKMQTMCLEVTEGQLPSYTSCSRDA